MTKTQLIRIATLKISYAGKIFLIDPMLGDIGSFESYGNITPNPTKQLPFSVDNILNNIDVVLVSHLHKDHFDDAARSLLEKSIPLFCQPGDQDNIKDSGFHNVSEILDSVVIDGIEIIRTSGNHGRGPIEKLMGKVSGFIFKSKNEPTIYVMGDTIFNAEVKNTIDIHHPEIIITNSGGAFIPGYEKDLILLDEQETIAIAQYDKLPKIIAVHLEALDHCTVNRASLYRAILQSNVDKNRFFIPLDGESLLFDK